MVQDVRGSFVGLPVLRYRALPGPVPPGDHLRCPSGPTTGSVRKGGITREEGVIIKEFYGL